VSLSERPIIYVITQGGATNHKQSWSVVLDTVRMSVGEGIDMVQIREKGLSGRSLFELSQAAAEIRLGSSTKLLINDRADVALAAGADGVHLTSISLPAAVIRTTFPKGFIVGVSTHSGDEIREAIVGGADFAVFGPVFDSAGKPTAQGTDKLSEVCEAVGPFPIIALGGIDATNCTAVIEAGASGVAGIRAFNDLLELRMIKEELSR
jgi:thiamine-phosphate pyrophosphorylase